MTKQIGEQTNRMLSDMIVKGASTVTCVNCSIRYKSSSRPKTDFSGDLTNRPMDGLTDELTDRLSHRDTWTHLEREESRERRKKIGRIMVNLSSE